MNRRSLFKGTLGLLGFYAVRLFTPLESVNPGAPTDLWGRMWTRKDMNAPDFGTAYWDGTRVPRSKMWDPLTPQQIQAMNQPPAEADGSMIRA